MHLHILQGVNVNQAKGESGNNQTYTGLNVIEGYDNAGDFAIVAECDKDGSPLKVSEAHLNLVEQTATATVRMNSTIESFDMRNPDTLKVDIDIKTAPELALRAMDLAFGINEFEEYYKLLRDTQTRR